jgi:hypothetical protein
MMNHPKYFGHGFCAVGPVRRFVEVVCVVGAVAYFGLVVGALWGTWNLIGMSPDTPRYLLPSAAALFEGRWDHVQRPFGYPAIAYVSIWVGGSLDALVVLQLALYVLSGLLIYVAVRIPFRSGSRADGPAAAGIVAPLAATGAMIAYFLLSSRLLASVFYVLPEFVSSATALGALTLCLTLMINRMHRPAYAAALATAAAGCAAMLISLKPAMSGTAGLTLILAAWGLIHQSYRAPRSLIISTLVAMVAIPSAVLVIDSHLVRKYRDFGALEFGALTAFCNNAPLIVRNLETPGVTGNRLLGEDGSRKVAQFLHETMAAGTAQNFQTQGFNGDYCLWYLEERRRELEREYFGSTPDEVVQTYRRLVFASVLEAPGSYALRFGRQLKAYLVSDQVTCSLDRKWNDRSFRSYPLVDRLIRLYATGPTAQTLPTAPGADTLCTRLAPLLNLWHLPVIAIALTLAILHLGMGWRRPRLDNGAQAVLLSMAFWLSGAVVVALVETFDRQRYVTVMFPVYIVALAITGAYLVSTVTRSLSVRLRA